MGDYAAGRAMMRTGPALDEQSEKTKLTPMEILDIVCQPHQGHDAELEDEIFHDHPFGKLLGRTLLDGEEYNHQEDEGGGGGTRT